jgi:CRP-like cAMP-binding protein
VAGRQRLFRPTDKVGRELIGALRSQDITAEGGTTILVEGQRSQGLYTVCEGWAIQYRQLRTGSRQILNVLLPGDHAGMASVLIGAGANSVEALTAAKLCVLSGRDVRGLLKSTPSLAVGLLKSRLEEQMRTDAQLTMLGRMSAPERVGYVSIDIYERLRLRGLADRAGCPFPLRRTDLADLVGLSKVHVMRALNELRSLGLMDLKGKDLIIPDAARLSTFVGYAIA